MPNLRPAYAVATAGRREAASCNRKFTKSPTPVGMALRFDFAYAKSHSGSLSSAL